MVTGGGNTGRVGIIQSRDRHPGSFDIVHVKVSLIIISNLPERSNSDLTLSMVLSSQFSGRGKVIKFFTKFETFLYHFYNCMTIFLGCLRSYFRHQIEQHFRHRSRQTSFGLPPKTKGYQDHYCRRKRKAIGCPISRIFEVMSLYHVTRAFINLYTEYILI